MKVSPVDLIGKRIEIPVHYDLWMRGAQVGKVTTFHAGKDGGEDFVHVKMEHPQVKRVLKLPRKDWEFIKVLR